MFFFLSNVSRGMQRSIAEEFFFSVFFPFFSTVESSIPLRGKKRLVWSFFPGDYLAFMYVTQYIYIMYISMSNIYIIHIYLSIPYKFHDGSRYPLIFLFIYAYLIALTSLVFFFPRI